MTLYYDRVSLLKITEKSQVSETLHNSSKYLIWFEVKMTKRDPKSAELRWTIKRCESREKKIARKLAWSYIQCLIGCVSPCGFFISLPINVRNTAAIPNLSKYWFAHSYKYVPQQNVDWRINLFLITQPIGNCIEAIVGQKTCPLCES